MSGSNHTSASNSSEDCPQKKLPRASDLLYSAYECPICFEYFVPPIVRCPNDHSFCLSCVEKSALGSSGLKCSLCRQIIDLDDINSNLEEQMRRLFIPCKWEGCKKRIRLSKRSAHQNVCKHSDDLRECYYGLSEFGDCEFFGTPTELVHHLQEDHKIEPVRRKDEVKYLWDFPDSTKPRFRPRIFDISYPGKGSSTSYFILEHYYNPGPKVLLFLVRSIDTDTKLQYNFTLYNKDCPDYTTSYKRMTMSFKGPKITEYPNCNTKDIICVPYYYLKEMEYKVPNDDNSYFAFSIAFRISMDD